jgi:hypothetical protein
MNREVHIPKPTDSGSDGSQTEGNSLANLVEAKQFQELPIAKTIQGLAASNSRAFGSEIASALIAGATTQLASELQYAKQKNLTLRNQSEQLSEKLTDSRIENAVLKEKIYSFQSIRHFSNIGIAIGTGLLGVGLEFIRNNYDSYGYISVSIGTLLILLGWFVSPKGVTK